MEEHTKKTRFGPIGVLSVLSAIIFMLSACSDSPRSAKNENNDDNPDVESEEVFAVVEELPQYPGGIEKLFSFLESNIIYPEEAVAMGIEGEILVQFVIERDGSISGIEVERGIGAGCDEEVVIALQSAPSFSPGSQRGRAVRVRRVMPITFQIMNDEDSAQGMVRSREINNRDFNLKVDFRQANGEWSGTISDAETGQALAGANIIIAGTTLGTVSDLEGNFRVKAKESNDLVVSFVGYQSLKLEGQ